jgi:hypothetical protein
MRFSRRKTMAEVASRLLLACCAIVAGGLSFASLSARADDALTADGDQDGMQVVIKSLKRNEGDTVTLRFQVMNKSDREFSRGCDVRDLKEHDDCGVLSGVYLLDQSNKKKYLVVRDSDGKCICAILERIDKSKSQNLWVTFPAPPAATLKMTVVVPTFEPIDGVPIATN